MNKINKIRIVSFISNSRFGYIAGTGSGTGCGDGSGYGNGDGYG